MFDCWFILYCFVIVVFTGFAFIYMEDERDADDAVRRLDNREFGPKGRRLRVEWTKASLLDIWCSYFYVVVSLSIGISCYALEKRLS